MWHTVMGAGKRSEVCPESTAKILNFLQTHVYTFGIIEEILQFVSV